MPCLSHASGAGSGLFNASRSRTNRSPMLAVAAQDVASGCGIALVIEGVLANNGVMGRIADHPLHIAFVVTLAGTAGSPLNARVRCRVPSVRDTRHLSLS